MPPYPLYKALPRDVVCGPAPAWTWFLLVYGVFFTVATTAVSVRVLGSSNCYLYSFLRALLFSFTCWRGAPGAPVDASSTVARLL